MKISRVHIKNFRSIKDISLDLKDTTVLIGPNNAGKSAILDAIKIVLSRRTGLQNTRFVESDIHLPSPESDPRSQQPTSVEIKIEEPEPLSWGEELYAELSDALYLNLEQNRRMIDCKVVYEWNEARESFQTVWQFLNPDRGVISEHRQSGSLSRFFNYLPIFWLDPLRDARTDFRTGNSLWTRLLEGIQIPEKVENAVLAELSELDQQIITADPQLAEIEGTITEASKVSNNDGSGSVKLSTLPQSVREILSRVGILMRNDRTRPWFPLLNQGQGLQSLAVIFLLKAYVQQRLEQNDVINIEPIFAIEEPEAHLHPHAVRSLWDRLQHLPGQKVFTTHSPYFVQNVELPNLKLVRLERNLTTICSVPTQVRSDLPWNDYVKTLSEGIGNGVFSESQTNQSVVSNQSFSDGLAKDLQRCYRNNDNYNEMPSLVKKLQNDSKIVLSKDEITYFQSKGQRNLGEIFFARRWVLVEGESDYLLFRTLSYVLDYPLDDFGVSIINFQQSSGPGVYASIAEALRIPWYLILDSDSQSNKFFKALRNRGFQENDLNDRCFRLDQGLNLERQLLSDGNITLLINILQSIGKHINDNSTYSDVLKKMESDKIGYVTELCRRISEEPTLVSSMPKAFITVINKLREM